MKRYIHFLGLVFILYSITGESFSQDFLYLNDVATIKLPKAEIKNGTAVYINSGDVSTFAQYDESLQDIKRNYIGINLMETIFGYADRKNAGYNGSLNRLNISYERLSKTGVTGFAAEILLSRKTVIDSYYGWYRGDTWGGNWFFIGDTWHFSYLPFNNFVKAGINYYPFNYTLRNVNAARFFCGISLLAGDVNKLEYSDSDDVLKNVFVVFLISNLDVRLYLSRVVQLKAGIDMSLLPFLVFIGPELGLNIGF